jgi:phosphoribosyl-AMP cyclohydrolase / phosphoribosyl-ATP pyrophosphohydrolase
VEIAWGKDGLVPAIVQDRLTGAVRMLAWMNREALAATIASGRATFFSRSRGKLWEKGETSGNGLVVRRVVADCDADAILLSVDPLGPTCHTGSPTCFFRRVNDDGRAEEDGVSTGAFLEELERTILARKEASAEASYTRSLFDGGATKIGAKIREEADELARAIEGEAQDRVAAEAADLIFHLLVGLSHRGVPARAVLEVLASRSGTSGLVEKAGRPRS